ncbi:helix-turn-helix domain-containing protein [Filimonas effusa]|uniref:Helix-turn-helix domain-containing protein n=2 Tax=Filimonas effusa TaxID=2508721 RepID=A0A4Q1D667_9BACT|nr:helix-turn-helix domain-containing protein [Filimonas effusa]
MEKPTRAEQKFAKAAMSELDKMNGKKKIPRVYLSIQSSVSEQMEAVEIPPYVVQYLKFLLENMAEGKAVQVSPIEAELTTQEAADLLGVSRPFLVKLLEQGKIPFKKVGAHRRVSLEDLLLYEHAQKAIREKQLNFIASQAQDLNIGYEL